MNRYFGIIRIKKTQAYDMKSHTRSYIYNISFFCIKMQIITFDLDALQTLWKYTAFWKGIIYKRIEVEEERRDNIRITGEIETAVCINTRDE